MALFPTAGEQEACLTRILIWCLLQVPEEAVASTVLLVLTGKGSPDVPAVSAAASLLTNQRAPPVVVPRPPLPCALSLFQLQTLLAALGQLAPWARLLQAMQVPLELALLAPQAARGLEALGARLPQQASGAQALQAPWEQRLLAGRVAMVVLGMRGLQQSL